MENLIKTLLDLERQRFDARSHWLDLCNSGDAAQVEARRVHLSLDAAFENTFAELVASLVERRASGHPDPVLLALPPASQERLQSIFASRDMSELLKPGRPADFATLANAWRLAGNGLDAARRLVSVLQHEGEEGLSAGIDEERSRSNLPEAFDAAWTTARSLAAYNDWTTAVWQNVRLWIGSYDQLTEALADAAEELMAHDSLSSELALMDFETRRAIVSAVDGGLIPCPEPLVLPQEERARTTVAVLEREECE